MNLISKTIDFVKNKLKNAEAGHDWFHVERVWNLSKKIAENEVCDILIVELGALLHDIADAKFHNGNEEIGPSIAKMFLKEQNIEDDIINQIVFIIENISFKNRFGMCGDMPVELQIVQDADRLDAIGAIGIARAFHFGGFKNNPLYLPDEKPRISLSKEEYKRSKGTSINHFYEKLLLIKDLMNTKKGKELAKVRHLYMEGFLSQFYKEWNFEL